MDIAPSIETAVLESPKLTDQQIELIDKFIQDMNDVGSDDLKLKILEEFSNQLASIIDTNQFEKACDEDYKRNYLFRDESGWEILLLCWKKGQSTTIHGHPYMCCYNFIDGDFYLQLFDKVESGKAEFLSDYNVGSGSVYADKGKPNTFDNHIHKIECKSDYAYSLNIYSDDACLGEEFERVS